MANSIEYVFPKEEAIKKARNDITSNGIHILEEKELNNGTGYKFVCYLEKKFGILIYFKAGISTSMVFENAPETIKSMFFSQHSIKEEIAPTVPIHASIKIEQNDRRESIKNIILENFQKVEVSQPTELIQYKLSIKNMNNKFTLTQFNNATLLLQGTSSSLFYDIIHIIQSINPLSDIENALLYIPKDEQQAVQDALNKMPDIFNGLYKKAQSQISKEAFDFLYENDKQTLVSAIGILETVKETNLEIPMYNPILYPFAKVFEGFIIRLLIEKCFFTFEEYQKEPKIADIGNVLSKKKFYKYIKDKRNSYILDKLLTVWDISRCKELHSDPTQNDKITKLYNITQVENRIGEISSTIMEGYRILIQYGYTEEEMLSQKKTDSIKINENSQLSDQNVIKEIPILESRIGTDESGKGDYFGPLVIAGVYLDSKLEKLLQILDIRDSKKNSDIKNKELASKIKSIIGQENYSIVYILPEKYNQLYSKMKNLNILLAWGHARAIENILNSIVCNHAIADQFGSEDFINKALMEKGKKITLIQTPKAERDIAVAAASILARDTYLQQLDTLEKKCEISLFKGASLEVENAAKKIVQKYGKNELQKYVKLHFKTTIKVLDE